MVIFAKTKQQQKNPNQTPIQALPQTQNEAINEGYRKPILLGSLKSYRWLSFPNIKQSPTGSLPSLDGGWRAGAYPLPASSRAKVPPNSIQNQASCPRNQGGTWKRLGRLFHRHYLQLPTSAKVQTEDYKCPLPYSPLWLYYCNPCTNAGSAARTNTHLATLSTYLR